MESLKAAAIEKLVDIAILSRDAVFSRAWSYPILGITYLGTHPALYKAIAPLIAKAIATSMGITAVLFIFTYFPQVAVCALFSGPFAPVTAAVLVLSEAYCLIYIVSKVVFLGNAQDRIFDAVLLQQGNETLVEKGRQIRSSSGFKVQGISLTKPLGKFSQEGMLRYIITLPLNSVPGIGTALFLLYNGKKTGPSFHARYFQLKRYDQVTREEYVEKRRGAYTAFGATALGLNLIPVVGFLFNITSTIGAALWASNLERTWASPYGEGRKVDQPGQSAGDMSRSMRARNQVEVVL